MTSESDMEKDDDEDDVDNWHLFDATPRSYIRYILQKFPTFELIPYIFFHAAITIIIVTYTSSKFNLFNLLEFIF